VALSAPPQWTQADVGLFEEIYQLTCTSRLNALYYSERLRSLQRISLWMEFTIAATASGSGIAALATDAGTMGSIAWKVVLLIAAVVAVIRPIYAPGKKIEQLTRQEQGYTTNYFALKKLAHTARQTEQITDDSRKSFDTIFDRHVQLSGDDEFAPDGRLLERCRTKTLEELPRHRYWWPFTSLMPEFGQSEQTPTQKVNSPKSVVIQPRIPSAGDLTRPAPRAPIADTSTS
jgi:hypothetical protein